MASVEVSNLDRSNDAEYLSLLYRDPRSMIYASPGYRDFLHRAVGGETHYLAARRDGNLVGVLPVFLKDVSPWGRVINSLPWYGSHGGCILASDSDVEAREALLDAFRAIADTPETLTATMILTPSEERAREQYLANLTPHVTDFRIGQITTLPEAGPELEDRLEKTCKQKTRNLVRKSRKQGFRETCRADDEAWRELYSIHCENMKAIGGMHKSWEHLQALREAIPLEQQRLSLAMDGDRVVAAMLLLLFNKTAEYFVPVIRQEYRSQQPLSFLVWEAMRQLCESGFSYWNWGGTWKAQKSLLHFKEGWGAAEYPYSYLIRTRPDKIEMLSRHQQELTEHYEGYYLFPWHELPEKQNT